MSFDIYFESLLDGFAIMFAAFVEHLGYVLISDLFPLQQHQVVVLYG